ncbi:hypothetical protein [Microbispora sp. NBRC 16548]|nr:hypothetical protein [Microbispora sp. NBRC 16548]
MTSPDQPPTNSYFPRGIGLAPMARLGAPSLRRASTPVLDVHLLTDCN